MDPELWLPAATQTTKASKRLVVLPHAGSGTAPWFDWRTRLPSDVELRVARLPGREIRLAEPPLTSMTEAITRLAEALRALPPLPLVIFGHSLGALLGYGICRELPGVARALVVSGEMAPTRGRSHADLLQLSDLELALAVNRRWGAVPPEILEEPEILEIFLPALRGDLTLAVSWPRQVDAVLDIPLHVFAGTADALDDAGLGRWADHTSDATLLFRHPGGHMAVLEDPAVTEQILIACLGALS